MFKERLALIDEIDRLNKLHPPTKWGSCITPDCEICPQLKELGEQYEVLNLKIRNKKRQQEPTSLTDKKVQRILAKGEFATKSEIQFLLEHIKMSKKQIAEELGLNVWDVRQACRAWGIV